jgi:hypothetical protein
LRKHILGQRIAREQITQVINRLDLIKVELIRLRATLLPEEELTPKEKRELEKSRRDVEEGRRTSLEDLLEELG